MPRSPFQIRHFEGYSYIDEGPRSQNPPVLLLHGMLGDLSNWSSTVGTLADNGYRVLVPVLPVYDMPLDHTDVPSLVLYVNQFLDTILLDSVVLAGNSLGGHIAILYTLTYPDAVSALILSGSSGIFEVSMGTSVPRRRDPAFIRERAAITFHDPSLVTDELIEQLVDILDDRGNVVRLIKMARSARDEVVTERLPLISAPTLLIWGRNDRITPPEVAETMADLLPNAQLRFIEKCGHAPMIEHPDVFNRILCDFLSGHHRTQRVNDCVQSSP